MLHKLKKVAIHPISGMNCNILWRMAFCAQNFSQSKSIFNSTSTNSLQAIYYRSVPYVAISVPYWAIRVPYFASLIALPLGTLLIPNVGTIYSQCGNVMFPAWEYHSFLIPTTGCRKTDGKSSVCYHKGTQEDLGRSAEGGENGRRYWCYSLNVLVIFIYCGAYSKK